MVGDTVGGGTVRVLLSPLGIIKFTTGRRK